MLAKIKTIQGHVVSGTKFQLGSRSAEDNQTAFDTCSRTKGEVFAKVIEMTIILNTNTETCTKEGREHLVGKEVTAAQQNGLVKLPCRLVGSIGIIDKGNGTMSGHFPNTGIMEHNTLIPVLFRIHFGIMVIVPYRNTKTKTGKVIRRTFRSRKGIVIYIFRLSDFGSYRLVRAGSCIFIGSTFLSKSCTSKCKSENSKKLLHAYKYTKFLFLLQIL